MNVNRDAMPETDKLNYLPPKAHPKDASVDPDEAIEGEEISPFGVPKTFVVAVGSKFYQNGIFRKF